MFFTEFTWFIRCNAVAYKYLVNFIYIFFDEVNLLENEKAANMSVK